MRLSSSRISSSFSLAALSVLVLGACKGDSVTAPGGESEVISRVTVTLTPATGAAVTAYIEDADGGGAGAPSAQVGALNLVRGTTYTGSVRFENRLVTPVVNITDEVVAEANEHRVYYTVSEGGVTLTTTDRDPAGRPLGVNFTLAVAPGAPVGQRIMRLVLCHYGDVAKPATSTRCDNDIDIDVSFALNLP
jgi:hypothetical protein